jgi:hypothetical protein
MIAALIVGGCALVLVGHLTGRKAHSNAFWWAMDNDPILRRETLEKLAQLEGMTLVGRE